MIKISIIIVLFLIILIMVMYSVVEDNYYYIKNKYECIKMKVLKQYESINGAGKRKNNNITT